MSDRDTAARKGRQAALVIAGTAVFWILVTLIGDKEGFSQGLRLVFDLLALLCTFLSVEHIGTCDFMMLMAH